MGYVVKIDDRGRIKLPKNYSSMSSVIILDLGNFFIGIPVPKDPILSSSNVIKSERDTIKLRNEAEINMKREIEENADRH